MGYMHILCFSLTVVFADSDMRLKCIYMYIYQAQESHRTPNTALDIVCFRSAAYEVLSQKPVRKGSTYMICDSPSY